MMFRTVIRADGRTEEIDVGEHYKEWNRAIGAKWGQIINTRDGDVLWCDEDGPLNPALKANLKASYMAGRLVMGDAILFRAADF